MPHEFERRYLPLNPDWRPKGEANRIVQGYFWPGETVNARIEADPRQMFTLVLDIKNDRSLWKFVLPVDEGRELFEATKNGKELTGAWTVRVRNSEKKGGELCLKGKAKGIDRPEYEYPLSVSDTHALLGLCPLTHITKLRSELLHADRIWEFDKFISPLPGEPVTTFEVELPDALTVPVPHPQAGQDITSIKGYSNAARARRREQFLRSP